MLKPGFYILEQPVIMGESSPDWRDPPRHRPGTYRVFESRGLLAAQLLGSYSFISQDSPFWNPLEKNLKPKEKLDLRDVLEEGQSSYDTTTILIALSAIGKISNDDIRAAKVFFESLDVKKQIELFKVNGFPYNK